MTWLGSWAVRRKGQTSCILAQSAHLGKVCQLALLM